MSVLEVDHSIHGDIASRQQQRPVARPFPRAATPARSGQLSHIVEDSTGRRCAGEPTAPGVDVNPGGALGIFGDGESGHGEDLL